MIRFQRVLLGRKKAWFRIMKGHSRSQNLVLVSFEWHCIKMANHKILVQFLKLYFLYGLLHCQNSIFIRCPSMNLYNNKISKEAINV